jgi:mannose-6-phosphate isomerase-like protein (cupin superfamily)
LIPIISSTEKIKEINKPWNPVIVAKVNDQVIRLAMFKNSYPMHKHDQEDELFFVFQGKITIHFEDESMITLEQGEMAVIPKGKKHSPRSELESFVIMFEPLSIKSSGD